MHMHMHVRMYMYLASFMSKYEYTYVSKHMYMYMYVGNLKLVSSREALSSLPLLLPHSEELQTPKASRLAILSVGIPRGPRYIITKELPPKVHNQ